MKGFSEAPLSVFVDVYSLDRNKHAQSFEDRQRPTEDKFLLMTKEKNLRCSDDALCQNQTELKYIIGPCTQRFKRNNHFRDLHKCFYYTWMMKRIIRADCARG